MKGLCCSVSLNIYSPGFHILLQTYEIRANYGWPKYLFFSFFFRCGGALKLQWEVVTHEASVHEGQKRSIAMMVFHSSSICHLASFLKLSPHIREVEPLPPPADGPPWDNELCQSIVPWITHTMFNNLKDIVWSVELVLFISSSQNWLTLLLYNIYSFYVWPCCTKLQFSDQKKSEICLQPVWSSLFDAHFFSDNLFTTSLTTWTRWILKMAFDGERKQPNDPFSRRTQTQLKFVWNCRPLTGVSFTERLLSLTQSDAAAGFVKFIVSCRGATCAVVFL